LTDDDLSRVAILLTWAMSLQNTRTITELVRAERIAAYLDVDQPKGGA
jgi:hypothetical protein